MDTFFLSVRNGSTGRARNRNNSIGINFRKNIWVEGHRSFEKEINVQDEYEDGVYIEVSEKGIPIGYEIFLGFTDNWNVTFDELIKH